MSKPAPQAFRVVRYEPGLFDVLAAIPSWEPLSKFRHRSYLDWYYASSDRCQLNIVLDRDEKCLGCQGRELMNFRIGESQLKVAGFSSFYAFSAGSAFYAFAACMRGCDAGVMAGGSGPAQAFVGRLKWEPRAVETYCLNVRYSETEGRRCRAICKNLLNRVTPKTALSSLLERLPAELRGIQVIERSAYEAGLLDFSSGFALRFAPDLQHLSWRYALDLPFVRYRLFQAFLGKKYLGYIILQDIPARVLVSQVDGVEPTLLAGAIIHAIGAVAKDRADRRQVILLASNTAMRTLFKSVGFRHRHNGDRPVAFGTTTGALAMPVPASEWLVNYDWGDRGLCRPFLDEIG